MDIVRRLRSGWVALLLAAAFLLLPGVVALGAASCGPPPPAKPHRRKAGESFPPLPLPATPLRRTERKRPPAPQVNILDARGNSVHKGKLEYG